MKKIFLILLLLFISGCTSEYTLEISNDTFKENINININNSEIPKKIYEDIELDDRITPFLNEKTVASVEKDDFYYRKKVNYYDNYIEVLMNKTYNAGEFHNSRSLNLCFDNYEFTYDDNYYIHAYGNFYCLYSDKLNINIKTNNKVIKHNATFVNGNTYTWYIDSNNASNIDIEFEVEKGFPYKQVVLYSVVGIILTIIVSILIYYLYFKRLKNNKI